jgi:hypothetical protein
MIRYIHSPYLVPYDHSSMRIELISPAEDKKTYDINNVFIASENPLYLGLVLKPSDASWSFIKSTREILVKGKEIVRFSVKYGIEVGESSIFFITPSSENVTASKISDIEKGA